jgi:hypothetical protein
MDSTKKTIEIENTLIVFIEAEATKNKRSFTQQLNKIVEDEKNRKANQERNNG